MDAIRLRLYHWSLFNISPNRGGLICFPVYVTSIVYLSIVCQRVFKVFRTEFLKYYLYGTITANENRLDRNLNGYKDYLVSHLTEQSLYSGWVRRYSSFNAIASSRLLTFSQGLQNSIRLDIFSLNLYI